MIAWADCAGMPRAEYEHLLVRLEDTCPGEPPMTLAELDAAEQLLGLQARAREQMVRYGNAFFERVPGGVRLLDSDQARAVTDVKLELVNRVDRIVTAHSPDCRLVLRPATWHREWNWRCADDCPTGQRRVYEVLARCCP